MIFYFDEFLKHVCIPSKCVDTEELIDQMKSLPLSPDLESNSSPVMYRCATLHFPLRYYRKLVAVQEMTQS
jgi:hypothetical protein